MLTLHDLSVRYGPSEVLKAVSLTVGPGEIVALLGANGAGKTTTLMAISGLVPAAAGTIHWDAHPISTWPPERIVAAGLVQIPEGRRVFPRMTVEENLRLGGWRFPAAEQAQMLARVWTLFPVLRERRRQLAGTLSGGEQQMLALGRGLIAKPRLLLLDEPSLGLAPAVADEIFERIVAIHAGSGLTVLMVEQRVAEALHFATRGYVLEAGRVVLEGSHDELKSNDRIRQAYLGM